MSAAGSLVAIIAAQRAQRLREVTDAFRLAGATAPERARPLAALGLGHADGFEALARDGVLLPGPDGDTWYLSEAAAIARRDATRIARGGVAVAITGLLLVMLGAIVVLQAQ